MDRVATFTQQHNNSEKTTNRRFYLDLTEAIVHVLAFKLSMQEIVFLSTHIIDVINNHWLRSFWGRLHTLLSLHIYGRLETENFSYFSCIQTGYVALLLLSSIGMCVVAHLQRPKDMIHLL